jgi:hypothetical protein
VPDEEILISGIKGLSGSTDFLSKENEITLKEA